MKASHVIAVVSAAVLMLAGLAVLPATVIIVPLLSVGSGAVSYTHLTLPTILLV